VNSKWRKILVLLLVGTILGWTVGSFGVASRPDELEAEEIVLLR